MKIQIEARRRAYEEVKTMKAGRHRSFDKNIALEKAMEVFWTNGYPSTSLTDLTAAMGINKPSLYAAFGNKEALFNAALDRYVSQHGVAHMEHLFVADKSPNERIQAYLKSIVKMQKDPKLPGGCFVCSSTSEIGSTCLPPAAIQTIIKINGLTKATLIKFFDAEKSAGNISHKRSTLAMANHLLTLQFGLGVMAKSGAELEELNGIIDDFISKF